MEKGVKLCWEFSNTGGLTMNSIGSPFSRKRMQLGSLPFSVSALTQVWALHNSELALAPEGAGGHVRGGQLVHGRALLFVPHHHHPSSVPIQRKVPEAPLLEGQGGGGGRQEGDGQQQEQGRVGKHGYPKTRNPYRCTLTCRATKKAQNFNLSKSVCKRK